MGYGLGTARYKEDPNAPPDRELIKTIVMAIKAGYYHIDGAEGALYFLLESSSARQLTILSSIR